MKILKKSECEEFKRVATNKSLFKDMKEIKKHKFKFDNDVDSFISFLSIMNSLANHQNKKFKIISGNNFLI